MVLSPHEDGDEPCVIIVEVIPDSPAAAAGLLANDVLLFVEDQLCVGDSVAQVSAKIKGAVSVGVADKIVSLTRAQGVAWGAVRARMPGAGNVLVLPIRSERERGGRDGDRGTGTEAEMVGGGVVGTGSRPLCSCAAWHPRRCLTAC